MNIKYLLLSYCIFEHKVCCGGRCGLAMSIRFQFFVYRHTTRHVDKTLSRALTIINCIKLLSGSESLLAVHKIVINCQRGLETMYHFMIKTLFLVRRSSILIVNVINYNFNAYFISQTDSYPGDLFA